MWRLAADLKRWMSVMDGAAVAFICRDRLSAQQMERDTLYHGGLKSEVQHPPA
jgi:hypothetical protein